MKNFQQTPKQRRIQLAKAKAALKSSRHMPFQPREAWTSKRFIGGAPLSMLETVQTCAWLRSQGYSASRDIFTLSPLPWNA